MFTMVCLVLCKNAKSFHQLVMNLLFCCHLCLIYKWVRKIFTTCEHCLLAPVDNIRMAVSKNCNAIFLGRLNKVGLKCLSVRPQKSSFDFNEIWYVGSGR